MATDPVERELDPEIVASVVRRYWRGSPHFTHALINADAPASVHVTPGEALIGWYQNPPPLEAWLLVFTTAAIYAVDPKGTTRVGVGSLLGYEFPESKTNTIDLKILTTEGERLLRVAGPAIHARQDLFRVLMIIRQLTL